MIWTFTLPVATPSLNEIQGWHWSHCRQEKQALGWVLRSALNRSAKIPPATGKRRLTITRHGRGRLDSDNLHGGCKWLVDALREARLILDDRPDLCELHVDQVVSRRFDPYTEIRLEDVA